MRILLAVYLSCLIYVDSFATVTSKNGVAQTEKAILSGSCFWCLEADLDMIPGVISAVLGYTGGNVNHPTYDQVSGGGTGHYESLEVTYNPAQVSYKTLPMAFIMSDVVVAQVHKVWGERDTYHVQNLLAKL